MTSVQERARQIELKEISTQAISGTVFGPQGQVNPLALEGKSAAPLRRIIEWSDIGSSSVPTSFPSRYRANGNILDFEGVSLDEGPRPLLPPRPTTDEVCEVRRASDGGALCTLTIKRNPLCDTFEAMSTQTQAPRTRSKSLSNNTKKIPTPILITDVKESETLKGSDFGPNPAIAGHDNTTEYDPYRVAPKTANLVPNETYKSVFGAIQGYLKTPNSPNIVSMKESISQSMSPVLSSARQGLEQAGKSMKQLGENIKGIASQHDMNELDLMAVASLRLQS